MALSCRRAKQIVRWMALCLFMYYVIKIVLSVTIGDTGRFPHTHPSFDHSNLPVERYALGSSLSDTSRCDKEVHVVSVVLGADSAREWSYMWRTLLHHRLGSVHVYLVSDLKARTVLTTLLTTWQLPYVDVTSIAAENVVPVDLNKSQWGDYLHSALPLILQGRTDKVILVSPAVRLMTDLTSLWAIFGDFNNTQSIGKIDYGRLDSPSKSTHVALIHVTRLRRSFPDVAELRHQYASMTWSAAETYAIPCSWAVHVTRDFNVQTCIGDGRIQAYINDSLRSSVSQHPAVQAALTSVLSILTADGEAYRHQTLACPNTTPAPNQYSDICRNFRYASELQRRTHLFYVSGGVTSSTGGTDITLVTIMTLDRFVTFEQLVTSWEGPMVTVVHVTDAEAVSLTDRVSSSPTLRARADITYHVVYKRDKYFPINYLRNMGLRNVTSPYVLFVDVDLVPTPGIYRRLQTYVTELVAGRQTHVALVLAAFEALERLPRVPQNKAELVTLWDAGKVSGYRMNRKWNKGHKPTNYDKWRSTDSPYMAIWKDAFEPYVVLPTSAAPLYREQLLERMGDKIAYGRELHARGYEFLVLPDLYILHLPHDISAGTKLWSKEKNYLRCGARLFDEYRAELKTTYPLVKF